MPLHEAARLLALRAAVKRAGRAAAMTTRRPKLFFDGGCRPNPGPMEAAVVLRGSVRHFGELGTGSSRDAEWLALIRAAQLAREQGLEGAILVGDALGVIREAAAALASGQALDAHAAAFLAAASGLPALRLRWIKREQNLAGIALAARHPR